MKFGGDGGAAPWLELLGSLSKGGPGGFVFFADRPRLTPRASSIPDIFFALQKIREWNSVRFGSSLPAKSARNPLQTRRDLAGTNAHLSDRDCLDLATDIVRKHPERWWEFQALVLERGLHEAAIVAAIDCQVRAMRLPPWREGEIPCMASTRGRSRASKLLRRMLPLCRAGHHRTTPTR